MGEGEGSSVNAVHNTTGVYEEQLQIDRPLTNYGTGNFLWGRGGAVLIVPSSQH